MNLNNIKYYSGIFFAFIMMDFSAHAAASDTTIKHELNGLINEWPSEKFSVEKETNIGFISDNDSAFLYMALSVPDKGLQMKMARIGMKVFIDLKGKKKESTGIEFPIKKESGNFFNPQNAGTDPEALKRTLIISMIQLKLFGFGGEEPAPQQLLLPGSAQIAIQWDSAGTLNIEYQVPLEMLGKSSSLDQKTISLGWKINSVDQPSGSSPPIVGVATTTTTRGRPTSPSNTRINSTDMTKIMKEQEYWTKYIFNFHP